MTLSEIRFLGLGESRCLHISEGSQSIATLVPVSIRQCVCSPMRSSISLTRVVLLIHRCLGAPMCPPLRVSDRVHLPMSSSANMTRSHAVGVFARIQCDHVSIWQWLRQPVCASAHVSNHEYFHFPVYSSARPLWLFSVNGSSRKAGDIGSLIDHLYLIQSMGHAVRVSTDDLLFALLVHLSTGVFPVSSIIKISILLVISRHIARSYIDLRERLNISRRQAFDGDRAFEEVEKMEEEFVFPLQHWSNFFVELAANEKQRDDGVFRKVSDC